MRSHLIACSALVITAALVGCSDTATAPEYEPRNVFAHLVLNHHAVTLSTVAPAQTVQLVANGIDAAGDVIVSESPTQFAVLNDTAVTVNATGLVQAVTPTTDVRVVATRTIGGVTRSDTAIFNVTTDIPPVSAPSLTILPPAGGGTVHRCNYFPSPVTVVSAQITDGSATTVPNTRVAFRTSNRAIATVNSVTGELAFPCRAGVSTVTVYADATVYGVALHDSLQLTVRPPLAALVNIRDLSHDFDPDTVTVDQGAVVVWYHDLLWFPQDVIPGFPLPSKVDVVFDAPESVLGADSVLVTGEGAAFSPDGGGNIPAFTQDTLLPLFSPEFFGSKGRMRRFPTPGIYGYHSTITGATGAIIVRDSTL